MPLSRYQFLPLVLTLALGCADGTAPPEISGFYLLESINGQALPRTIHDSDGYTTTVVWSTLTLDAAGYAALVECVRQVSPNNPQTEITHTTGYAYHFDGENVVFGYSPPCPPNALCIGPPAGRVVNGSTLVLSYPGDPPYRPASVFRLTESD
jgi:hypothetical protein